MARLIRSVITGGAIATVISMFMRRSASRNTNMMNRFMNSMINMMGRVGAFRLMGRSRWFKNMVKMR